MYHRIRGVHVAPPAALVIVAWSVGRKTAPPRPRRAPLCAMRSSGGSGGGLSASPTLLSPTASDVGGINTHHEAHDAAVVVAVRMRPFLQKERNDNEGQCVTLDPAHPNGFKVTNPDYTSDIKRFNFDFA